MCFFRCQTNATEGNRDEMEFSPDREVARRDCASVLTILRDVGID